VDRVKRKSAYRFSEQLGAYGPQAPFSPPSLAEAEQYCRWLAGAHAENFSLIQSGLPRTLQQPFCNLYAYCRWADDLADETGNPQASLALLDWWEDGLRRCYLGSATHPVYVALQETVRRFNLPQKPLHDLLKAFRRDQCYTRYETVEQVLDYCCYSANPVGRIVLHLADCDDSDCQRWSDSICTGLQLANFCQDVARDYARGRIYLAQEIWARHGWSEADFVQGRATDAWRSLLAEEVERAESFLNAGGPLVARMPAGLRWQTWLFQHGGCAILREIRRARYDVWSRRPVVRKVTKLGLLLQAVLATWKLR
jgi:squalene synthase HpnC